MTALLTGPDERLIVALDRVSKKYEGGVAALVEQWGLETPVNRLLGVLAG